MQFRDATPEDLYDVISLLADDPLGAQREHHTSPLPAAYQEAFEHMCRQEGNRLIVAVSDTGAVKGCLQLTVTAGIARLGASRATIEGVRIHSDMRAQGLGRRLFEFAIEEARLAGCGLVQLTTDRERPDAHRFYKSLGFEASHIGMKLKL